ncbi:hypothetical protein OS493_001308 [Desmophyllum pertusum]|uniref:Uncharacterized protein n=1 Tax=Desmophyllum pertusum TaxID=174260 RepID=A0A9W9ZU69_9CNID|nr:hypothetical protein OS493_001308 [Desmophyllum pertusum]
MKEEAKGDAVDQATIHENVNTRVVVQQKNEFIKALYVIPLEKENFCVTEDDKAFTVVTKRTKITCSGCTTSAATGGICQHSVDVAETCGTLCEHIEDYKKQNDLESKLAFRNVPRGAGTKKRQKKPRRGQNNIQQQPLVAEIDPNAVVDSDLDCPKPSRFTEY